MKQSKLAVIGWAGMVLALAGCGGGGSDEPAASAPEQVPAQALWKNFVSTERTWAARDARPNADNLEMGTTVRPKGSAQLRISASAPLATYDAVEVTTTARRNNADYQRSSYLYYLNPADASLAAVVVQRTPAPNGVASTCLLPAAPVQPVPAQAGLKASGTLLSSPEYALSNSTCWQPADSQAAPVYAVAWSYEADDDGRPLFCVTHRMNLPSDFRTEATCLQVQGNALGAAARLSFSSKLLSFVARNG